MRNESWKSHRRSCVNHRIGDPSPKAPIFSGSFSPFGGFLKEFLAPFGAKVGLRGLSASQPQRCPSSLPDLPLHRGSAPSSKGRGGKGMSWALCPPAQLGQAAMSSVGWECHGLTHPKVCFWVCALTNCSKSIPQLSGYPKPDVLPQTHPTLP